MTNERPMMPVLDKSPRVCYLYHERQNLVSRTSNILSENQTKRDQARSRIETFDLRDAIVIYQLCFAYISDGYQGMCGVHTLNALVQAPAVDAGELFRCARALDAEEDRLLDDESDESDDDHKGERSEKRENSTKSSSSSSSNNKGKALRARSDTRRRLRDEGRSPNFDQYGNFSSQVLFVGAPAPARSREPRAARRRGEEQHTRAHLQRAHTLVCAAACARRLVRLQLVSRAPAACQRRRPPALSRRSRTRPGICHFFALVLLDSVVILAHNPSHFTA